MFRAITGAIALLLCVTGTVTAQEAAAAASIPKFTPVRLQVVLSRYDGDKKVSSMPNTLWVNVSDVPKEHNRSELRIGMSAPIHVIANNTTTVAFKDIGNVVNCDVVPLNDGRFRLDFSVEQSSIDKPPAGTAQDAGRSGAPLLRMFRYGFEMVLRDGQTAQAMSATDPITGEVLKVDVTLNVIK